MRGEAAGRDVRPEPVAAAVQVDLATGTYGGDRGGGDGSLTRRWRPQDPGLRPPQAVLPVGCQRDGHRSKPGHRRLIMGIALYRIPVLEQITLITGPGSTHDW